MGLGNMPVLGERASYSIDANDTQMLYDEYNNSVFVNHAIAIATTKNGILTPDSLTCRFCFKSMTLANTYTHDMLVWYHHLEEAHPDYLFELQLLCGIHMRRDLKDEPGRLYARTQAGGIAPLDVAWIAESDGLTKEERGKMIAETVWVIRRLIDNTAEHGEHNMELATEWVATQAMYELHGLSFRLNVLNAVVVTPLILHYKENDINEASWLFQQHGLLSLRPEPKQVYCGADSKDWIDE